MTDDFAKDDEDAGCEFCDTTWVEITRRTKEFALMKAIEVRMTGHLGLAGLDVIIETARVFERYLNGPPEMPDALVTTETKN